MDGTNAGGELGNELDTPNFNLSDVIAGLASDLVALRTGRITVAQAQASAALGKQVLNGAKIALTARRIIGNGATPIEGK